MKKILLSICLITFSFAAYSQVNCNGTAPSTINASDKVGICNGNLQRTATVGQLMAFGVDTTKIGRIQQGRGTAPIFMYFNGTAWVRNDTSYIPRSGADNITGNLKSNQSYFEIGLNGGNNSLQFSDQSYTQIFSGDAGTGVVGKLKAISTSLGVAEVGVDNLSNAGYSRSLSVGGSNTTTPDLSFKFDRGIAYYNGDYSAQMETSQNLIPSLKKVKQLISDSISSGGGGTLTSVYSANSDISVDSSVTGKRKITLNNSLTSGYIKIGDGTNQAFARQLSGDVTVSNTGVTTIANGAVTNAKIADGTIDLGTKVIGGTVTQQLGLLINPTLNAGASSLYTDVTPNTTVTFGSNGIALSGGNNTSDNYLYYTNYITNLQYWAAKIKFVPNSDGDGLGIGLVATLGKNIGRMVATGANKGKVLIDVYTAATTTTTNRATSTLALSYTNSTDSLELIFYRSLTTWTVQVRNITTSSDWVSTSYVDPLIYGSSGNVWNAATTAIFHYGGSQSVRVNQFSSKEITGADVLVTGTSIPAGAYAGGAQNMYTTLLGKTFKVSTVTGGGNTSNDYLNLAPQILSLKPKVAIWEYGINDIRTGISQATTLANLRSFITMCNNNGIIPMIQECLPISSTYGGGSNATWQAAIISLNSAYATMGVPIIPAYSAIVLSGSMNPLADASDGLHINEWGNAKIYNAYMSVLSTFYPSNTALNWTGDIAGFTQKQTSGSTATWRFENTSTDAGASAQLKLKSGTNEGIFAAYSPTYATASYQNRISLSNPNAGVNVVASGAAGTIEFCTGGFLTSANGRMSITGSGNIGIGTTAPQAKLHVAMAGAISSVFDQLSVVDAVTISSNKFMFINGIVSNDTSSRRGYVMFDRTKGTNASPTAVTNGFLLGTIAARGYDGTTKIQSGQIDFIVNGTVSTGVMPTDILFQTTATNATSEKMRITSVGNVGIGTSAPSVRTKLHVAMNGAISSIFDPTSTQDAVTFSGNKILAQSIIVSNDTANRRPIIALQRTHGTNASPTGVVNADLLGSIQAVGHDGTGRATTGQIDFIVNGAVSTNTIPTDISFKTTTTNAVSERMVITSGGNVGIGNTSPTNARLQVRSTTEQHRTEYDASNYWNAVTDASGNTILDAVGSNAGFQIGSTGDKIGFLGATPVVRSTAATDLGTVLSTTGLRTSGTTYTLNTSGTIGFSGTVTLSGTNAIKGTTTNNNAAAGNVGENVESVVASGSAVSLTNATTTNITSVSLTAGDWQCAGNVNYIGTTATVTNKVSGITTTSETMPTTGKEVYSGVQMTLLSATDGTTVPSQRFSLSGTTTVYLVGQPTFSAGTMTGYGYLGCRRMR